MHLQSLTYCILKPALIGYKQLNEAHWSVRFSRSVFCHVLMHLKAPVRYNQYQLVARKHISKQIQKCPCNYSIMPLVESPLFELQPSQTNSHSNQWDRVTPPHPPQQTGSGFGVTQQTLLSLIEVFLVGGRPLCPIIPPS